jgi:hypothetical protein
VSVNRSETTPSRSVGDTTTCLGNRFKPWVAVRRMTMGGNAIPAAYFAGEQAWAGLSNLAWTY